MNSIAEHVGQSTEPDWMLRERQGRQLSRADIAQLLGERAEELYVDVVKYNPTNTHPNTTDMLSTAQGMTVVQTDSQDDDSFYTTVLAAIIETGTTAFAHFRRNPEPVGWTLVSAGDLHVPRPDRSLHGLELVICVSFIEGSQHAATFDATVFAQCPMDWPAAVKQAPFVAFRSQGHRILLHNSSDTH